MATWSEYLKPDVIARLAAVGLHSHTAVEGTVSGLHRSPLKGVSPEFDDYREYSFGDDLKNLDWRVRQPERAGKVDEQVLAQVLGKLAALLGLDDGSAG